MKTLSTPIARTKKGITSAIIKVTLIPKAEKRATDVDTLSKTIMIPHRPIINLHLSVAAIKGTKKDIVD